MNLYRVLLAEDEAICRTGILQTVPWERLGFTVVGIAEDGVEILEKITSLDPDVLVTDIKMPGMTGLEALRTLRRGGNPIETIILTGFADFSLAQEAIKEHAFSYVLKMDVLEELPLELAKLKEKLDMRKKPSLESQLNDASTQMTRRVEEALHMTESDPIRQSVKFILKHFTEPLRMEDVARAVYMNPAYFSRLFKKETGENFSDMLTRLRMEWAHVLLENTKMRVSEIARSVGYSDVDYFVRRYKKAYGMPPMQSKKK